MTEYYLKKHFLNFYLNFYLKQDEYKNKPNEFQVTNAGHEHCTGLNSTYLYIFTFKRKLCAHCREQGNMCQSQAGGGASLSTVRGPVFIVQV